MITAYISIISSQNIQITKYKNIKATSSKVLLEIQQTLLYVTHKLLTNAKLHNS